MAGRFPDAPDIETLFKNLKQGVDSLGPLDRTRIDATALPADKSYRVGGYLDGIENFDYRFFNISRAEAQAMSPLLRFLLEVAQETFENAAYSPVDFYGSNTSIFVNEMPSDYYKFAEEYSPMLITGNSSEYLAAGIARQFNLNGAAIGVNASCASSLAALYMACCQLNMGDCDYALVCGGTIDVFPFPSSSGLGVDSPSGKSRAFSQDADGMSHGEVVAAVLLKPLDRALEDGDIIHAVVKGVAMTNNGDRAASLTAPDSGMQALAIERAWRQAGIDPSAVGFIEAHGSGTQLGDSLEVAGLNSALRKYFKGKFSQIPISSIKSNIGHSRSASGISGLIKGTLSLKHKMIFPALYCQHPSRLIDFDHSVVYVNTTLQEWKQVGAGPRYAGVSSIGANGLNCHVVLEEAPRATRTLKKGRLSQNPWACVTLSSMTPEGLVANAEALRMALSSERAFLLEDISYTLACGRRHDPFRFAALANDLETLVTELDLFINSGISSTNPRPEPLKNIVLVFSDQTSLPVEMVEHMKTLYPPFADAFQECLHLAAGQDNDSFRSFAFQYSFYKCLECMGIRSDNLLGIGVGDIALAVIFEEISLTEAVSEVLAYTPAPIADMDQRVKRLVQRETEQGPVAFIDMGPHGVLTHHLEKEMKQNARVRVFDHPASLNADPWGPVPSLIRFLYSQGYDLDWKNFFNFHCGDKAELPAYRFQRERCWLRDTPPPFLLPALDKPRESTGKVLREPASDTRKKIAAIWADVLSLSSLSLADDFFQLGGDSLKASKVILAVNESFSLDLSFEDLFDFPTLESFCRFIEEETAGCESRERDTVDVMADIWQETLKEPAVRGEDNFFDLGGHSLLATQVLNRVKGLFKVELNFEDLFNYPTLEAFSRLVDNLKPVEYVDQWHAAIEPAPEKEAYAVSPSQRRMYLMQQNDRDGTSYNAPLVLSWDGELDRRRLEEALRKVIDRHEMLRTGFDFVDGEPVQLIATSVDFSLEFFDARQTPDEVPAIIRRMIRPFDLSTPPLLRVGLIQTGDQRHVLVADVHHIATDGTSEKILVHDVTAFYTGAELPPLKLQYKDYSEWLRDKDKSGVLRRQEEYWLETFAGPLPDVRLPFDAEANASSPFAGDTVEFEIAGQEFFAIKELARASGATPFMFLLGVFNILLARICGCRDIVVGSPVTGRTHKDLEHIMGMFVNMLALRNQVDGGLRFEEFLARVRQCALAAYQNQDFQFDRLVEKLGAAKQRDRHPLFDVVFAYQSMQDRQVSPERVAAKLGGARIGPYGVGDMKAKFALRLTCVPEASRLCLGLEYQRAKFKRETVEMFQRHFLAIVRQTTGNPAMKLEDIELSHSLVFADSELQEDDASFNF